MVDANKKKIVVIGSGVSGMNVIFQLIKSGESFDLTCITMEKVYDYSTCGMPYVLEGVVPRAEDIILHKPEFFSEHGVRIFNETEVINIDLDNQTVTIATNQGGNENLHYDFLVIATGRVPFRPPMNGLELPGVYTLMNWEQCMALQDAMPNGKSAVIIGGGAIGLELAMAFNTHNIETTVVELTPTVLPMMLDPDMGELVVDWLSTKGIKVLTDTKVAEILGTEHAKGVRLADGIELPGDIIVLSTGIRPNIELASKIGLDIGSAGGIVTNGKQQVHKNNQLLENVFALGDCVETTNLITGQSMISALASTAILQARTISDNIRGISTELKGTINPALTYLAGLQVGAVGLTSHTAKGAGIEVKSATTMGKSQSRYIPGWKNIHFKFLAKEDKLIGAQIIGEKDVKERINALTLAIREGISIHTLLKTERCYTPPLALLTDPMFKALEKLI